MKVWIVEHGCYSDRHVVAVADSLDLAEKIARLDNDGVVNVYDLNEIANRIMQGVRRWEVTFLAETGDCLRVRHAYDAFKLYDVNIFTTRYPNAPSLSRHVHEVNVNAKDEAEAVKIAADERRVWLASSQTARGGRLNWQSR